jgi:HSP20 family molecular chaperone IbpA
MSDIESKGGQAVESRQGHRLADMLWSSWPLGGTSLADSLPLTWRDLMPTGAPPMRVEEFVESGHAVVRAELPGVDPDKDIEITVEGGVLTIRAERRAEQHEEATRGYRSEFHYGRLVRQVRLPQGVAADQITARYADGILEVRLPAPAAPGSAQRISIERG